MNAYRRAALALFLAGTVLAACGDDTDPTALQTSTRLLVSLETPHTDDGALVVILRGPGLLSAAKATERYDLFWRITSTQELRAIVAGGITAGPLFSVEIPGGGPAESYSAELVEVAARDDRLRESISGYRIGVEPTGR